MAQWPSGVKYRLYGSATGTLGPSRPLAGSIGVSVFPRLFATHSVRRSYDGSTCFATGALPQHVVPSYDLLTLWGANNLGNTLTPIDPANGREGPSRPGADPYNLYFNPDGH